MAGESNCEICGSTNFDCLDGFYYCSVCSTQSQVSRVIEDSQDFQDGGLSFALHLRKKSTNVDHTKNNTTDKKEKPPEPGPYAIYECLTILIRRQVEALILLGAPACLKDCVFDLWIKFLRYKNVAFVELPILCDKQPRLFPSIEPGLSQRKSNRIWSFNPTINKDHSDNEGDDVEEVVKAKNSSEEFSFTLNHSLALCYIGCKICDFPLLPSDMIRFARNSLIPTSFKSSGLPARLKPVEAIGSVELPGVAVFNKHVVGLVWFLGEPNIEEQDGLFAEVISRFIINLNLPKALIERVNYVVSLHKPDTILTDLSKPKIPLKQFTLSLDLKAMGYILLTLKLIFGLDDETEIRLSNLASQRNKELPVDAESTVFNFSHWLMQSRMRKAVLDGERIEEVLRKSWFDRSEKQICKIERDLWYDVSLRDMRSGNVDLMDIFHVSRPCDSIKSTLFPLRDVVQAVSSGIALAPGVDLDSLEIFTANFAECSLDFNTQNASMSDEEQMFPSCFNQLHFVGVNVHRMKTHLAELEAVMPLSLDFLLTLLAQLVFSPTHLLFAYVQELERRMTGTNRFQRKKII